MAAYDLAQAMDYLNENGFLVSTGVATTGFEQLDDLQNPRIATILDIVIRESPSYVSYHVPTATFDDLVNGDVPCLAWTPLLADTRRWENRVFEYNLPSVDDMEGLYKELRDQLDARTFNNRAVRLAVLKVRAGQFDYKVLVYLRSRTTKTLPGLTLRGIQPSALYSIRPAGHRVPRLCASALRQLSASAEVCAADLTMDVKGGSEINFDCLADACATVELTDLKRLKGSIQIKKKKDRTDFDCAFLASYATILDLHPKSGQASKQSTQVVNVANDDALPFPIASESELVNLDSLKVSRLVTVAEDGRPEQIEEFSMAELLRSPGKLMRHALAIIGADNTSGMGKTALALHTATRVARAICIAKKLPDRACNIAVFNRPEDAKGVDLAKAEVQAIVFDECNFSDTESIQHFSPNMAKVLFDASMPCSYRCKGVDEAVLPAGVPRIFTANAATGDDWLGVRCHFSEPIRRKMMLAIVSERLVNDSFRRRAREKASPQASSIEAAVNSAAAS